MASWPSRSRMLFRMRAHLWQSSIRTCMHRTLTRERARRKGVVAGGGVIPQDQAMRRRKRPTKKQLAALARGRAKRKKLLKSPRARRSIRAAKVRAPWTPASRLLKSRG
jgi:hypothetical protein